MTLWGGGLQVNISQWCYFEFVDTTLIYGIPFIYFGCSEVEPPSPTSAGFQPGPTYEPPCLSHMDITQLQWLSSGAEFDMCYYGPLPQSRTLGAEFDMLYYEPLPQSRTSGAEFDMRYYEPLSQSRTSGAEFDMRYYEPLPQSRTSGAEFDVRYYEPLPQSRTSGAEFAMPHYEPRQKPKRIQVVCMCLNGINSKPTNAGGSTIKMKRHNCHYAGCEKSYTKASHLRSHLLWHTGERPFGCNWLFCGKRFAHLDNLKRHLKTHTGEKHLACVECNKRFMRSDHLKKHIRTHKKKKKMKKGMKKVRIQTHGIRWTLSKLNLLWGKIKDFVINYLCWLVWHLYDTLNAVYMILITGSGVVVSTWCDGYADLTVR